MNKLIRKIKRLNAIYDRIFEQAGIYYANSGAGVFKRSDSEVFIFVMYQNIRSNMPMRNELFMALPIDFLAYRALNEYLELVKEYERNDIH
jgi:hypothetical protein